MKYLILVLALVSLGGCVFHPHNVSVLSSKDRIKLQEFSVGPNDYIVCDPAGCRVLEK